MTRTPIAADGKYCRPVATAALHRPTSALRIRVEDPAYLPELAASLSGRIDAVVMELNERELEVGLLGSYVTSEVRAELGHRLRVWRLQHPLAVVSIVKEEELEAGWLDS
jgi:hypothetical protein